MQLKAKVENQDRAKRGKNDAGGMKSSSWRGKQVRNGTADDRSDDAEHDCPEDRHVHVQHRFRDDPSDQPNNDVPDQVKHNFPPSFRCKTLPSMAGLLQLTRLFERQVISKESRKILNLGPPVFQLALTETRR